MIGKAKREILDSVGFIIIIINITIVVVVVVSRLLLTGN